MVIGGVDRDHPEAGGMIVQIGHLVGTMIGIRSEARGAVVTMATVVRAEIGIRIGNGKEKGIVTGRN
jgi:hypothetical protein